MQKTKIKFTVHSSTTATRFDAVIRGVCVCVSVCVRSKTIKNRRRRRSSRKTFLYLFAAVSSAAAAVRPCETQRTLRPSFAITFFNYTTRHTAAAAVASRSHVSQRRAATTTTLPAAADETTIYACTEYVSFRFAAQNAVSFVVFSQRRSSAFALQCICARCTRTHTRVLCNGMRHLHSARKVSELSLPAVWKKSPRARCAQRVFHCALMCSGSAHFVGTYRHIRGTQHAILLWLCGDMLVCYAMSLCMRARADLRARAFAGVRSFVRSFKRAGLPTKRHPLRRRRPTQPSCQVAML